MAEETQEAIKVAAEEIVRYVREAASMAVETKYVDMDGSFEDAQLVFRTIVKLDGDCEVVLPARKNEYGGLEVDNSVFEIHQQNVQAAIDYRAKVLQALVDLLREGAAPPAPPQGE